jgi:Holliday junction resolvasome RuvABC DNA-binding subunit
MKLDLSWTRVADVGPLTALTCLQTLDVSYTKFADVETSDGADLTNVTDIGHLSALGVDTKFADCACCDESFLNA